MAGGMRSMAMFSAVPLAASLVETSKEQVLEPLSGVTRTETLGRSPDVGSCDARRVSTRCIASLPCRRGKGEVLSGGRGRRRRERETDLLNPPQSLVRPPVPQRPVHLARARLVHLQPALVRRPRAVLELLLQDRLAEAREEAVLLPHALLDRARLGDDVPPRWPAVPPRRLVHRRVVEEEAELVDDVARAARAEVDGDDLGEVEQAAVGEDALAQALGRPEEARLGRAQVRRLVQLDEAVEVVEAGLRLARAASPRTLGNEEAVREEPQGAAQRLGRRARVRHLEHLVNVDGVDEVAVEADEGAGQAVDRLAEGPEDGGALSRVVDLHRADGAEELDGGLELVDVRVVLRERRDDGCEGIRVSHFERERLRRGGQGEKGTHGRA